MSLISSVSQEKNLIIYNGQNSVIDSICPAYVDITNPKYLTIDEVYVASLLIVD